MKKIAVITEGRETTPDFWESGILDLKLTQHPFLVFVTGRSLNKVNYVKVVIVNKATDFITVHKDIPDDTEVMVQWQGQWKSDFMQTSVGEIRNKLNEREK